jgi:NAD(P)-dependent dehydrogenase (short-subunit alcohol dehydrogenase family)
MRGLEGRGALITGGSSGIGRATARRFLEEGSRVFVGGLDAREVAAVVDELGSIGEIGGLAGDVSLEDDVAALVGGALDALGSIDVLINNAGIATKNAFLEVTPEAWDRTLAVNLRGMFLVARSAARAMLARDPVGGVIVNMASTNALGGEADFAPYNASKGGVLQLTRTMAVELGPKGIRVNCVCPGFIQTPMIDGYFADQADPEAARAGAVGLHPLGRLGTPLDIADGFVYLASDDARWVTGTALTVDGGLTSGIWGG